MNAPGCCRPGRARLRVSVFKRLAAALVCAIAVQAHAAGLPSFEALKARHHSSDIQVLDRHGEVMQTLRTDMRVRQLPWVALADVSPAMRLAIVLSEDQRFWAHSGVDWQAVAASAWANLWNQRTRGASTVTMQLAGMLDEDAARSAGRRNWSEKVRQLWTATQLERHWRKSEVLEAYLNLVPFRGELVGLPALSALLFHKHPDGLDAEEAAIAAALVRSPNAPAPAVARRACQILRLQHRACLGIDLLTASALGQGQGSPLNVQRAPHLARALMARHPLVSPTGQVRSTLDARVQNLAQTLLRQALLELNEREVEDGAVVVLDNASGEVLAWVGGSGDLSRAPAVDAVLARRQPGSTLKPFLYELAFERRLLTPASLLHDAPVQLPTGAGLYIPQNYDHRFKGWVTARTALGNSLNVPAVRVAAMLGPDALAQRLNQLGLALKEPGGYYGPGLALGSAEVTLLDLSNAYRTLANAGRWSPVRLQAGQGSPRFRRVLPADASHLVTDILSDNTARALTFGLDSVLATRGFAAVKTGTSKDMRDNWCVGYTSRYTVGVWVGNASGAPMREVSGISGAAPIWAALVRELHRSTPSVRPPAPPGIVRQRVHFQAAQGAPSNAVPVDPDREDVFLAGTQQAVFRLNPAQGAERPIHAPQDGAIFALDPDIPPAAQQLTLSTAVKGARWWLDGRLLPAQRSPQGSQHGSAMRWPPWPGHHVLSLRRGGQELDRVHFEVRGAEVRVAAKAR